MFDIYDPRRGKDYTFKDLLGRVFYSSLKNNVLVLESQDAGQACDEKLIKHLAKQYFSGTRFLLSILPANKNLVLKVKKCFKNEVTYLNRKDFVLIGSANLENIETLGRCYKNLQHWEDWTIGFLKPKKEIELVSSLPDNAFDFMDLFMAFDCFKAIFSTNFEVPFITLLFFDETKFDDYIQSVPLV